MAQLRTHLAWLASPEGTLRVLRDRLADAQRTLRRARDGAQEAQIRDEIADLKRQIADRRQEVADPLGAREHQRFPESLIRSSRFDRVPASDPSHQHLEKLRQNHRRRLNILELQAAKWGELSAPPHLLIEIEDLRTKIAEIEAQLGR